MKVQKCRTRLLVALGLLAVIWVTAGAYEAVRRLKVGDPTQLVTVGFTSRSSEPTDEDVYAMVDEVIEQTLGPNGLAEIVAPGDKVVIKVNIVHVDLGNEWEPGRAIITDPRVVRHVAELVRDIIGFDAPAELTVVDACFDTGGPSDVGNIRSFAWARLERTDDQNVDPEDYCYDYDADGILDGTSFAQLVNTDAYGQADRYPATVNEPVLGSIDPWYPKFLRTEAEAIAAGEPDTYCDVLIGLPLFKSHGFAGMTGAMKLHYGFRTLDVFLTETGRGSHNAPGYPVNDPANFDNYLCAQHLARTYDFVIMDCLTGNRRGPNLPGGELVNGPCDYILTDAMMASTDSVAIDTVETLFAGYDQSTVEFLQEARLDGLGTDDPAKIRVAGLDAFTIHRNTLYATYNPSGLYPFENGWGGAGVMADFSPPTNVTISDPTLVSGTTYSFDYTADELDGNDLGLARVELLVNGELVGYLNNSPGASGAIEQDMAAFMQGSHACRVAAWDYAFGCSLSTEKTFTAPNSITVTAPSGGAEAEGGQSFDVTWDWTGDMATVWVRLLKNGVHVDYIGRNTSNDGTLTWDVPTGLTADTDYAIQVIHDTGSGYVYDQSEPFAIVQPGITVTAPAGGATLEGGFSYDVTWTSTGTVGPVWVRLLKGGAHVDYIGRNTPNDGLLSWTVPYGLTPASDYSIQIFYYTGVKYIYDQSLTFNIVQPTITVTAPSGGQIVEGGTLSETTWVSTGTIGPVWVELLKGGAHVAYIGRNTANDGSLIWSVPYGLAPASDYSIQIFYYTGVKYIYDESPSFTIIQPAITVTAPNGTESWQRGTSEDVTWTSTGTVGPVWIELLKGGAHVDYIARNTANDGSFTWDISAGLAAGSDYKIQVFYYTGVKYIYDRSNGDFSITP